MRLRADRDEEWPEDPSAYWRRRFLILGGGLAVLAVLAWRFGSAHPASSAGTPADAATSVIASSSAMAQGSDGLPSAAYGNPWQSPSPTPSVVTSSPAMPSAGNQTAKPKAVASPTGRGTPSPGTAGAKGSPCEPADIVLSLFTSEPSYAPGAQPQFEVYAVSTAVASCRMAYGPGSVRVIVTSRGHVVWDSSTCKPAPAPSVQFSLGVPQMFSVSWNRAAKQPPGCAGSLPARAWGTFEAVAIGAGQSSTLRSFTLLR